MYDYDAIVIGGGHAGIEASLAVSRMGFRTLLITQSLDAIGRLSCNPAIGGLAKGNLVREVDALGGEMAHLIDSSMIRMPMCKPLMARMCARPDFENASLSSSERKRLSPARVVMRKFFGPASMLSCWI